MSIILQLHQSSSQVRDLGVRENMEQTDAEEHPQLSPHKPLCDYRTGRWLNPSNNMNLEEIYSEYLNSQLDLTARVDRYLEESKQAPTSLEINDDWDTVKLEMEKSCVVFDHVLSKKTKRLELEEVQRYASTLHARVCEALDYIMRWIMGNPTFSKGKHIIKQNCHTKDLDDKAAEVRLAAQALEKWAGTLLLRCHKNMFDSQAGMCFQQLKVGQQVQSLEQKFDQLTLKLDRVNEMELVVPMVYNSFQPVLRDQWHQVQQNHTVAKSRLSELTSSEITAQDVMHQFLFDPDLVPRDMEYLLRQGTVSLQKQLQPHRLRALQDNPRIKAWLSLDNSSLLLVNGNSNSPQDLSTAFFSAKIVNTLIHHGSQPRRNIDIIPLAYFCGQHQDYQSDIAASPAGLAMSLLLQLVDTHKDFESEVLQGCLEEIVPDDLGSILNSLATLLGRLPLEAIVFVIIDGVEHFSRPGERRIRFCEVVSRLVHIFREQQGAKVKFLFTSAQEAGVLEDLGLIMDDEIVNIAKSPPP